ncbi:MAG: antitoxin Xre-like helix-turn-helix domain-containing protein [Bryobacteraceae bacterium]|jgi:putative toxin-antitoxin system antitoxin component (TIGR02293 family)
MGTPVHAGNPGFSLGLRAASTEDLIRQLEHGLPFRALGSLETASGLPPAEIAAAIGIPERTLARRKAAGRLSPDESERLLRLASLFEKAVRLFEGDVSGAVRWLTSPKRPLDDRTPLAYSRTEIGAREVEALIGRLEHGVF